MSLRSSIRFLSVALIAFFVVSCWDDESTPTGPAPAPVDTTRRDTSKIDTSKKDTAKKDTTKVDTSKTIVGPASSDSLAPGQKSKDIQLGGVVGSGKSVTWVKFQGTSGHTYTFTALPRGKATLQVFLLNGKDTLAQVANPLVGDSVVFPCLRGGTHLIRLIGPAGEKLELKVGENSLIPMYFEGADSYEPDNDTARAFPWDMKSSSSQRRTTHFAGAVDIDMIRLSLDSGTTLTVTANGTSILPRLGRPNATLLAADGSVLAWSENPEGTWTHASFQSRTAYLKLRGSESTDPYTVSVKSTAGLPVAALLPDSLEPDGALGQGPLLNPDSTVVARNFHGYVNSEDVDRFRLIADSGMVYHFTVESKSNPELAVATKDGIRQAVHDSSVVQANARSWSFLCQKTGEYSVVVKAPEAVPYRIVCVGRKGKPSWVTQPDSFELDDTRDRAVVLGQERRELRRQLVQGDVDWHSVQVQAGQTWVLSIVFQKGNAFPEIYDADSVLVAKLTSSSECEAWSRRLQKAGTYYVRLVGSFGRWMEPVEYTVTSQVGTSVGDVGEPDDSVYQAVEVSTDGQWIGRTSRLGDQDWMKVKVPAGNQLRVWLEAPDPKSAISVVLAMRDAGEPSANRGPNPQVDPSRLRDSGQVSCPRDSTVLLVAKGAWGDTRLDAPYRLRLSLFPLNQDPLEPDDNRIPTIASDSTWTVRELHPGDIDQMSIPAKENQACTFRVEGVDDKDWTADHYVEVDLFGTDSRKISWEIVSEPRAIFNRQDGSFLLRVTAPNGFQGSYPYRVLGHCRTVPDGMEPDEGISKAVDLPYDSLVRLRYVVDGDQDWMRLAPAPGKVRYLQFASDAGSPFFDWTLFRKDSTSASKRGQWVPLAGIIPGVGAYQILVGDLSDTNTYYLGVRIRSTKDDARYGLRAWAVSDPDPFESTDNPLQAPLLSTQPTTRWISKGDTDLFRLHLDAGQALRPVVTGNVRWSLLTKEGKWASQDLVSGVLVQSDSAVDYLVKVNPTKDSAVFQAYSMAVVSMPNDTSKIHRIRAKALAVVPGDSVVREGVTSYTDTVWYRIHLEPGQNVFIQAQSKGRIALSTQDSAKFKDSLGFVEAFYRAVEDTCLYVGFVPRSDSLVLSGTSLRIHRSMDDPYEPDNSVTNASRIDSGVFQQRILAVGNTDFIQFPTAPEGATWEVEFRFSGIEIATNVYNSSGSSMGLNNSWSMGHTITTYSPKGTGPFYLQFVGVGTIYSPHLGGTRYRIRMVRK